MHGAGTSASAASKSTLHFALGAAIRAAARDVSKTFFRMEFLLAGSKREVLAAFAAIKCFVGVAHG